MTNKKKRRESGSVVVPVFIVCGGVIFLVFSAFMPDFIGRAFAATTGGMWILLGFIWIDIKELLERR